MAPHSGDRSSLWNIYGLRLLRDPRFRMRVFLLLLAIVLGLRLVQFAVFSTQIQWGYDFSAYWQAAVHLLDGSPIFTADQLAGPYAPQGTQYLYLYPPALAAAVMPFAILFPDDYRAAAWVWMGVGVAIVVAVVLVVGRRERLFEPDRFGGVLVGTGRWLAVAVAFTLPPLIAELVLGNVHLLLLGLLAAAWLGIRATSAAGERVAGVAVGIAVVIKVFPGLIVLWFLVTGRRRSVIWAAIGAAAFTIITLPLTGIQPWLDYPTVLANLSAPSDTTDTLAPTVWLAPYVGFTAARLLVTTAALAAVVFAAIRRPAPIGFAVALIASVLAAPALYHHYLALMVLPFLLAAGALRGRGVWVAAAFFLLWGGTQPAPGDFVWVVNRAMPTLGILVLFGAFLAGPRTGAARLAEAP